MQVACLTCRPLSDSPSAPPTASSQRDGGAVTRKQHGFKHQAVLGSNLDSATYKPHDSKPVSCPLLSFTSLGNSNHITHHAAAWVGVGLGELQGVNVKCEACGPADRGLYRNSGDCSDPHHHRHPASVTNQLWN